MHVCVRVCGLCVVSGVWRKQTYRLAVACVGRQPHLRLPQLRGGGLSGRDLQRPGPQLGGAQAPGGVHRPVGLYPEVGGAAALERHRATEATGQELHCRGREREIGGEVLKEAVRDVTDGQAHRQMDSSHRLHGTVHKGSPIPSETHL